DFLSAPRRPALMAYSGQSSSAGAWTSSTHLTSKGVARSFGRTRQAEVTPRDWPNPIVPSAHGSRGATCPLGAAPDAHAAKPFNAGSRRAVSGALQLHQFNSDENREVDRHVDAWNRGPDAQCHRGWP